MHTFSIRHLVLLLAVTLTTACTPIHIYMPSQHEPDKNFNRIIQDSLTELTGLSPYSSNTKTNDSFLIIALPGIPLKESELTFSSLSGKDLTGELQAVDQAYRFAKLVNQVVVSASNYESTGIELTNLYPCLLRKLPVDKASESEFNDLKLIKLSSPTYNDDFYLTTVIPSTDLANNWIEYNQTFNRQDIVVNDAETTSLLSKAIPSHRFKASLLRLDLQRHSMLDKLINSSKSDPAHINQCLPNVRQSVAVITGLILAKDIEVNQFSTSNAPIMISNDSNNFNDFKPTEGSTSMQSNGPIIIGIIAKQL